MAGPAEAASTSFASSGAGVAAGIGGGILSSLAGAGLSFGLNAAQASKSWDRQKNLMTRGPGYIMGGLRAAGINPILAAGSIGTSFGKAAQAAGTSVTAPDLAKGGMLAAQVGALKANTAASLATADNQSANADITRAGFGEAAATARFWQSEEGKRTIRLRHMKEAVPESFWGTVNRGLYSGYQTWKDSTSSALHQMRLNRKRIQNEARTGSGALRNQPRRSGGARIGGNYDH